MRYRSAQLAQVRQLYRSMRDSIKQRRLVSRNEDLSSHPSLIKLQSPQGEELLIKATEQHQDKPELRSSLHIQAHPAFCASATVVTVLRSFGHSIPNESIMLQQALSDATFPAVWYRHWGMPMLDALPVPLKRRLMLEYFQYDGMPLAAVKALFDVHGHHTTLLQQLSVTELQQHAEESFAHGSVLVTNYGRSVLEQRGTGHLAPVAALSEKYVLLLEVNQWRYSSFWVPMEMFWMAVAQKTPNGNGRGCLIVSKEKHI